MLLKGFVLQLVLLRAHATDDGCDASEVSILQRPHFSMAGSVVPKSSDVNSGRTSGPEASPEDWFESCLIPHSQNLLAYGSQQDYVPIGLCG